MQSEVWATRASAEEPWWCFSSSRPTDARALGLRWSKTLPTPKEKNITQIGSPPKQMRMRLAPLLLLPRCCLCFFWLLFVYPAHAGKHARPNQEKKNPLLYGVEIHLSLTTFAVRLAPPPTIPHSAPPTPKHALPSFLPLPLLLLLDPLAEGDPGVHRVGARGQRAQTRGARGVVRLRVHGVRDDRVLPHRQRLLGGHVLAGQVLDGAVLLGEERLDVPLESRVRLVRGGRPLLDGVRQRVL